MHFLFKELGIKLIIEYCDGIKLAIKFVDAEATIIKIKTIIVINKLSIFPIMSVGLVKTFPINFQDLNLDRHPHLQQ